ncbi:hypothetical protein [Streptomyces sp. NBC_00847]|uniref:hypothetical protein n=1 Tax=unclassified Streptomyces TaxID=2593676 RepID=UPI0022525BC2|nr:hypothetical protein [Streptomyces sp. NBC_00847]MCX4878642.1 hypothetical protein [Streptomyces sp. NBC_00847]
MDRPLATAARTAELGGAVGALLPADERVLVQGSGGISHAAPSLNPGARELTERRSQKLITDNLARAAEAIDPERAAFLATLAGDDWQTPAGMAAADLAPVGTVNFDWASDDQEGKPQPDHPSGRPIRRFIRGIRGEDCQSPL